MVKSKRISSGLIRFHPSIASYIFLQVCLSMSAILQLNSNHESLFLLSFVGFHRYLGTVPGAGWSPGGTLEEVVREEDDTQTYSRLDQWIQDGHGVSRIECSAYQYQEHVSIPKRHNFSRATPRCIPVESCIVVEALGLSNRDWIKFFWGVWY